jgi:L-ascorbate metabolism protein UlaG (beta-lactamase superfamily)
LLPVGEEPFPNGGIVNIGAYAGTWQASKSYFGNGPCQTILAGDINGDCKVDAMDLQLLALHWLEDHKEKVHLQWLGHSAFKIWTSQVVIYVDPYKISGSPGDATYVLCSHSHGDHYSPGDIAKVAGPGTQLIGPADVISSYGKGIVLTPGQSLDLGAVRLIGVRACNTNKTNHPKANNWLGFVIEIPGKRIYHAGDTDLIDEMKGLGLIDVAMLPVGGTYTMNATEAATATTHIQPRLAIPMHWGTIVGSLADAQTFAQKAACPVQIMSVGQTIEL